MYYKPKFTVSSYNKFWVNSIIIDLNSLTCFDNVWISVTHFGARSVHPTASAITLLTEMDRKDILYLGVSLSCGRFISRLQCDPWPRAVAGGPKFSINFLLGMSGIFSCVQPTLDHWTMPNWVFTMWYPRPFFCFTHKGSWVWWPWSILAWSLLYHVAEEKQAQCFKREVLCQRILLMMDTSQRQEMSWAIVKLCRMRSRNLPPPLCSFGLSNENETVREPSAIQCPLPFC